MVMEVGSCPGLKAHVSQSCFLCLRGSADHAAPLVLTSEGLHLPWAEPHLLCSYGHLHPPAGRRSPAHLDPWDRPPVSPPTPHSPGNTGVTCLGRSSKKGAYADAGQLGFSDTRCSRPTAATALPRLGWVRSSSPCTGNGQGPRGLRKCQGPWQSSRRPVVPAGCRPSFHQCHPAVTLRALGFPLSQDSEGQAALRQDADRRGRHLLALTTLPRAGSLKQQEGFSQVLQVRNP